MMLLCRRRRLYIPALLVVLAALGRQGSGLQDQVLDQERTPQSAAGSSPPPDSKKRRRPLASIPSTRRLPTTLEHLAAGTVGGMSGVFVSYPLDTVRIRMQTSGRRLGPVRMASDLLREVGIAGFYKGVASPVAGAALIKSSVFGGYGLFQNIVRRARGKDDQELSLWEMGIAAMGSGLVGAFVVTPVERIKVVMQAAAAIQAPPLQGVGTVLGGAVRGGGVASSRYSNAWGCARGIVAEQGVRGLYAGLGPTLLREIPGYACYFATYEALKRLFLRDGDNEESSRGVVMLKTAVSGGFAGLAAWLPIYPIDVVKSHMQSSAVGGPGMLETATHLWQTEGLRPFTRGLAPTLARAIVNHASTFMVYEAAMSLILSRSHDAEVKREDHKTEDTP